MSPFVRKSMSTLMIRPSFRALGQMQVKWQTGGGGILGSYNPTNHKVSLRKHDNYLRDSTFLTSYTICSCGQTWSAWPHVIHGSHAKPQNCPGGKFQNHFSDIDIVNFCVELEDIGLGCILLFHQVVSNGGIIIRPRCPCQFSGQIITVGDQKIVWRVGCSYKP